MVRQQILAIIGMLGSCSIAPAYSQIVPDGTTVDTSISGNCQSSCSITGGTIAEQNLFHSFTEFNVRAGESIYFSDPGVTNIFSRITGTNPSEIFGTLGILGGNANLFLINPNGIVFGEGATLDLNGSFFATTASEIKFGDRAFSTDPEVENLPLLTVNPSALFFNQVGQNGSIIFDGANLAVSPQQNLTLLGKQSNIPGILLKNSTINVSEGNIFLGAVNGNATVEIKDDLQPQFSEAVNRGDITLTQASKIVAENSNNIGDREINLDARNLEIKENSNIFTFTSGLGNSANIKINASESVKIIGIGTEINAFQQSLLRNIIPDGNVGFTSSALQTITSGTGNAGNIKIATSNLTLDRGGTIASSTSNQGRSGNIAIDVLGSFVLQSSGLLTGSDTSSSGNVGKITIDTRELLIKPGSNISSSTLGTGDAGDLIINASDLVQIEETPANSIIPTGIFTNTIFNSGKGGNLTIDTQKLSLYNGGQLSASSGIFTGNGLIPLGGEGGNILINAKSVEVSGVSSDGIFPSSISSATNTSNPAGNITIDTGSLLLNPYGSISASSIGTGKGGNIKINAADTVKIIGLGNDSIQQLYTNILEQQVQLENIPVGLTAFTALAGDTGSISIVAPRLSLESGALITTGTFGEGNAGNIEISTSESINIINSIIAAPTISAGDAGNINLDTKNLNLADGGVIVSVSSSSGNAGDINVLATESIEFSNTIPDVLIAGSISTASYTDLGFAGNLTVNTRRLSIKDGANIQTSNISLDSFQNAESTAKSTPEDKVAKLTIDASESIEISGSSFRNNPFTITPNSQISTTSNNFARASNIKITTKKLSLFDGGEISVNSLGQATAGSLEIVADSISLDRNANLNGTTLSGRGGNIVLRVNDILALKNNSQIDTDSLTFGDGGNIDITADFVIASKNSSISANALTFGNGGNVSINAIDLFVTDNSNITADSQQGLEGTVNVRTSFDSDRYDYAKLPQKVIPTENIIVQSCGSSNASGAFTYAGRGGLPANPLEFQTGYTIIADLDLPENIKIENFEVEETTINPQRQNVVEAEEWKINQEGNIELVASAENSSDTSVFNTFACPL